MQYRKIPNGYVVRFEQGEDIINNLNSFLRNLDIMGGSLQAIGAIESATLAVYNPDSKDYDHHMIDEQREITSLVGTISQVERNGVKVPHVHAHIALADADFNSTGGHLVEATVRPTCEMFIYPTNEPVQRTYDEATNLKLLRLQ